MKTNWFNITFVNRAIFNLIKRKVKWQNRGERFVFSNDLRKSTLEYQVYSNTRVLTQANSSQLESTQVKTNQHESDKNQHESNTSPTRVQQSQHESTRIKTSPTRVNTNQDESNTRHRESTRVQQELTELN